MVDWDSLRAPPAPPASELPRALALAVALALPIAAVPFGGIWTDGLGLGIALALLATATALAVGDSAVRGLAAAIAVLLCWKLSLAIERAWLPDALRGLSPQTIVDGGEAARLLVLRVGLLLPTVALVFLLARCGRRRRARLRRFAGFGDCGRGIRWPLPWWGVPAMPVWMFVLIGAPCALPAFLPMIDFDRTAARWAAMSGGAILMLPVLAFANALLEEFVFRAGLLTLLSGRALRPWSAALPAALAFGFVHFQGGFPSGLPGALLLSVGGYVLCYLTLVQRGLAAAILWHFAMDLVVLGCVFR